MFLQKTIKQDRVGGVRQIGTSITLMSITLYIALYGVPYQTFIEILQQLSDQVKQNQFCLIIMKAWLSQVTVFVICFQRKKQAE